MSSTDWRSAESYADLPERSLAELAWEFLRRNPDYQRDVELWKAGRNVSADDWAKWGLIFPADPDLSADAQPIFWRPEVYPRTIVLVQAPVATAQTLSYAPRTWRGSYHERLAADGVHGLLITAQGQFHLWSPATIKPGAPFVCLVPLGADAASGAAAVLQFWRHLRNTRQERQRRPDAKRLRVCRSLQALDGHAAGRVIAPWPSTCSAPAGWRARAGAPRPCATPPSAWCARGSISPTAITAGSCARS